MTSVDAMEAAARDREDLAELLGDLGDEEWAAPSLCAGWTVRDVVAHLLGYEGVPLATLLRRMVRGRLSFSGMNAAALDDDRALSPDDLLKRLRDYPRPTGITAARGGAIGLVDGLVHQQDIRRPLGRPRSLDPDVLRFALSFAVTAPPLRGFWQVRGTRVVATDVDWAWGRGKEARGTGEAVLMTLAGRRGVAQELTGPGAETLRQRLV